jgi:hypothetical protein
LRIRLGRRLRSECFYPLLALLQLGAVGST